MTTREELSEVPLPEVAASDVKKMSIRMTSGTTGKMPLVFVREVHGRSPAMQKCRRVIFCHGPLSHRLNLAVSWLYDTASPTETVLAPSFDDCDDALGHLLSDFTADSIQGTVSLLLHATKCMSDRETRACVKVISMNSEIISKEKRQLLEQRFPNTQIVSAYVASEVGAIGFSYCGNLPANCYHPRTNVLVEVLRPDAEGVGSIAVSTNSADKHTVRRYEPGDVGRLLKMPCPCGNPIAFEVHGRINFDFIKLCGALVRLDECDRVMNELKIFIADYRAIAEEVIQNGKAIGLLSMQIIPTETLREIKNPEIFIEREISRRLFLTPTQTLRQLVHKGLFMPLQVLLSESFPASNKEIKLRLLAK